MNLVSRLLDCLIIKIQALSSAALTFSLRRMRKPTKKELPRRQGEADPFAEPRAQAVEPKGVACEGRLVQPFALSVSLATTGRSSSRPMERTP